MKCYSISFLVAIFLLPVWCAGQGFDEYLGDESILYSETKQVNQFFRRFNGEEDPKGNRLYPGDSLFHSNSLRDFYLDMIFDRSSATLSGTDKERFIGEMIGTRQFLDFHGGGWIAEVNCTFVYQGVPQPVTLFLLLEEVEVGSKWVIHQIYFEPYKRRLNPGQSEASIPFLHPMSHELDFMNLNKVFREPAEVGQFASEHFEPDYLTLFLFELTQDKFAFRTVNSVKFHFFQIDGWYFQLNDIQRQSGNRGWLITQLVNIPEGQEKRLLDFIYRR